MRLHIFAALLFAVLSLRAEQAHDPAEKPRGITGLLTLSSKTPKPHPYQWLSEVAATGGIKEAFDQLEERVPAEDRKGASSWLAREVLAADFKRLSEVLDVVSSRQGIGSTMTRKGLRAMRRTARAEIIVGATWRAIRSDKKAALEIIDNQLQGPEKDEAFQCAVMELIQQRLLTDAKEVVARIRPGDDRLTAVINLAHSLGRRSVSEAMVWLSSLEEKERLRVVDYILEELVDQKDVEGLKIFLASDIEPEKRKRAIFSIVSFSVKRGDIAGVSSFIDTLAGDERTLADQHLTLKLAESKTQ